MAKAARGELDAGGEPELRVARELRVRLAIVEEVLPGDVALQRGDEVLSRDTVSWERISASCMPYHGCGAALTGFVEEDRHVLV